MSAPWYEPLVCSDHGAIRDAHGITVSVPSRRIDAAALVHRANAYPKLVEALDEIAEREHADSCALVMTDGASSCTCHVVIALEAVAALASTREEG